jgi:hypothetical protein
MDGRHCLTLIRLAHSPFTSTKSPWLKRTVHEECLGSAPEKDNGTKAFRPSLPWPSDPLFDNFTPKVSVDLAALGNPFVPGEALKPLGLEDPHIRVWISPSATLNGNYSFNNCRAITSR